MDIRTLAPGWAEDLHLARLVRQQGEIVVALKDRQHPIAAAVDHGEFGCECGDRACVFQWDIEHCLLKIYGRWSKSHTGARNALRTSGPAAVKATYARLSPYDGHSGKPGPLGSPC